MLKIGQVNLGTNNDYIIVWYNNIFDERIDLLSTLVANDIEDYSEINTSNCAASYIKDTQERIYGDKSLIEIVKRIRQQSSFLQVKEDKNIEVIDKQIVMTIEKSLPDINIYYKKIMVNGKLSKEEFSTSEGEIIINSIKDTPYVSSNKPINISEYEVLNKFGVRNTKNTVKTEQAEFLPYDELLRKYPEVIHVLDNDYRVVDSYDEAVERLSIWVNSKEKLKSVDIESYSTDWGPGSTNLITGVFLGFGEGWSTYFPFRQQNFKYNLPIEFLKIIFDAVNNQPPYPEVIILAHNAKFEVQGFYQEFRDYLRVDVDTFLLAVLVNPLVKKGTHTLKALTSKVDGKFYLTLEQIFIGPIKFNVLPPEIVLLYGCPDATSPAKVYKYLMDKMPKDEYFVKRLEMGLIHVKALQEFYGIKMDQEKLDTLIENEEYNVEKLGDLFRKIHKTSRNINSNDVLTEILYYKLKCPVEVRTDKGKPATSKFAIDRIIETGKIDIKEDTVIPEDINDKNGKALIKGIDLAGNRYSSLLIYQQYKLCGKELGALNRLRKKSVNGFFKFYINQSGAGSNRQTSDAHQFSDTMKSCAIADSPYHGLVSCDYKQVELRILAGNAKEDKLIKLEQDPAVDIHRAILSLIQGKPMYMISEEDRKAGKSVNFGVVYMMSEYGLARRDYGPKYTKENLIEERNKITDFFNSLPHIKNYLKMNEEFLKNNGYIKTAFNYYRYFPELLDPTIDNKAKSRMIRSGNNTPVQGFGAQLLKMAETKVWNYIRSKGWDKEKDYDGIKLPMVRMILPIHDEILLSYDKSIPKEEICKMFKECMEIELDGMPPFFAAPAFIDNWLQAKDAAYEVDVPFRDLVVEEYNKGRYLLKDKDYLKVLQEYREKELRDYMYSLIAKYVTPEEVAKNVKHDCLTHTLIETIPKSERKKLSHTERIEESVKRYMDAMDNGKVEALINNIQPYEIESEENRSYIEVDEWVSNYSYIDANGDLIIEDNEMNNDEYFNSDEEEIEVIYEPVKAPKCIYLSHECIVDLSGIPYEQADKINRNIQGLANKDEFYRIVYIMNDGIINTDFKVGYVKEQIESLFEEEV